MIVIIPFAADSGGSPNMRGMRRLDGYFKALMVSVASLRYLTENVDVILLLNFRLDAYWLKWCELLNIRIVNIPFSSDPGEQIEFRSSYYKLDAIAYGVTTDEDFLVVDPDIIYISELSEIGDVIASNDFALFEIPADELPQKDNDIVHFRLPLSVLNSLEMPWPHTKVNSFYGGEVLAVNKAYADTLCKQCAHLFQEYVKRKKVFFTEEHIYTSVSGSGARFAKLNDYVSREWTHFRRKLYAHKFASTIIHLPAEKGIGFDIAFDILARHLKTHPNRPLAMFKRPIYREMVFGYGRGNNPILRAFRIIYRKLFVKAAELEF